MTSTRPPVVLVLVLVIVIESGARAAPTSVGISGFREYSVVAWNTEVSSFDYDYDYDYEHEHEHEGACAGGFA